MTDPQYPRGKIAENDGGALGVRVSAHKKTNTVIVDFGKAIEWIGFDKNMALEVARIIIVAANSLPGDDAGGGSGSL